MLRRRARVRAAVADAVVVAVGNVDAANRVHGDAFGIGQLGARGRAVVTAKAWRPISRHGGDHTV